MFVLPSDLANSTDGCDFCIYIRADATIALTNEPTLSSSLSEETISWTFSGNFQRLR